MLSSTSSCVYQVDHHARCLEAVVGDSERHRFLVGTSYLGNTSNQIHLLEYKENKNELSCIQVLDHPDEVIDLSPHPNDADLFLTCTKKAATLWRMNSNEVVETLNVSSPVKAKWDPESLQIAVLDSTNQLRLVETSSNEEHAVVKMDTTDDKLQTSALVWDPHHPNELSVALEESVKTWDVRSKSMKRSISHAHKQCVRDIDYNPNRPYYLVTGGDDGSIRFWDLRKSSEPLKTLSEHTHWVWSVKYNRFHDQLLLSSGSDTLVNLWRISSISSSPLVELEHETAADLKIRRIEDHEDSVYTVTWGACDSWIFASLSYDGRVAINHVPSAEKYKILL